MSAASTRFACRITLAIALLIAVCESVSAQTTQASVLRDQTIVWNLSMPTPITSVTAGTVLEVVGRVREFYIVRLPASGGRPTGFGRIAISQVRIVQGVAPTGPPPPGMLPSDPFGEIRTTTVPTEEQGMGFFAFGDAGLSMWSAKDSFSAVLGTSRTPIFGVGGQVRIDGRIIVEGSVERSSKTGERVFIHDGEVFKLGIRDTVRVTPVSFTALYRQPGRRVSFYGGGGFGQYFYKEDSDFAEPGDNISERFSSYHAVFGAEFGGLTPILKTAIEVQFTNVSEALGTSGASQRFNERNLGGIQLRVKILAGR